jgi:hypothetical protein
MSQSTPTNTDVPDPEVVPRAKRRQFAAEYKLRILGCPSLRAWSN